MKLPISICSLHAVKSLCHRFGNAFEKTEEPSSNVLSTYYDYYYVCHFSKPFVVFMHRTHRFGKHAGVFLRSALRGQAARRIVTECVCHIHAHTRHTKNVIIFNFEAITPNVLPQSRVTTLRCTFLHLLMCPIFASLRRQRLVRNDEMGKITGDSRVAHSAAAPAN